MKRQDHRHGNRTLVGAAALGILVGCAGSQLYAGMKGPTEHKGVSVTELGIIDAESLNAQLGLEGLILRMRAVTVQPGGHIGEHDHYTRPGLVYMVDGTWVEGRPDGETTYRAGVDETMPEDKDTVHWVYNRTDQPATAIVCGIQPGG